MRQKDFSYSGKGIRKRARSRMDSYYKPKIQKYGNSAQAVGWVSEESQHARFDAACDIGDVEGSSILDVGCGLGHFYGKLRNNLNEFSYVGIDLSSSMIHNASRYYPEATFLHRDILSFEPGELFDYAVTIGPYNVEVNDNEDVMRRIIENMFAVTRKGIAVSMTWGSHLPSVIHFFDAERMSAFCRNLTQRAFIRKNREIGDIMLYLYHDPEGAPPNKETAGYAAPEQC